MPQLIKHRLRYLLALQIACLGTGFIALAEPASAQTPTTAQRNAIRDACRSDYEAHCASVPTGGKPALTCLQKNMASLSPGCQKAVNAVGQSSAAPTAAPASTAAAPATPAAPPAATSPAAGPAKAKAATVGAATIAPTSAAVSPRQEIALARSACSSDFRTHCSGMRPGGGRVVECLRTNAASLSPTCQSALMELRQAR